VNFVIGNKGYMAGGTNNFINKKDLWEYNPVTDTWTQKADCPGTGRYSGIGFSITNYGYIGLGQTGALGTFLKDIWEYNPATNTWTRKIDFPYEGRGTAVAFSINGKAYAGAGGTPYNFYKDLWELTP
jgi:N-acetylneuraminic acid mutarotase